jgi:dehydrogenase/reductase SDR family protein 7B
VVVITGATSALGQSLAHRFYNAGCKVVLVSRREHELARIRSQLVSSRPNNVPIYQPETVVLDLDDVQSLPAKAAEILDKCGQVDVLLNNGSTTARSDVLSSDVDVDIRVMNVNYFGTVALTKGTWHKNINHTAYTA